MMIMIREAFIGCFDKESTNRDVRIPPNRASRRDTRRYLPLTASGNLRSLNFEVFCIWYIPQRPYKRCHQDGVPVSASR